MPERKKKAFTLAEVLITLAIIGIVAALTIPSLLVSIQNKDTVTRLKKVYSVLGQAMQSLNGDAVDIVSVWQGDGTNATAVFGTKLNYIKSGAGSWPNLTVKYLNNTDWMNLSGSDATAQLSDGTLLHFFTYNNDCTAVGGGYSDICGLLSVDINGFKSPNIWGRDVFMFYMTKTSVNPTNWNDCTIADGGQACAEKVLLEDAMNY